MKKILAAVPLVLMVVLGLGAPASAQVYPPVAPIVVAPTTVAPGASFVVTFTGCQLGETVAITLAGVTVTTSCVGAGGTGALVMQAAGGSATATLTAPTAPGTYTITATGLTSGFTATVTITVAGQTTTTTATGGGGGLPTTGSDSTPTLWIAGTAVAVGAGLLAVGLKRRRPAAS